VLDRLLERVARPAGEDLAARGAFGAEQLDDGATISMRLSGRSAIAAAARLLVSAVSSVCA